LERYGIHRRLEIIQILQDTVEKIVASGIFEGEQSIEIFDCFDGYLKLDDIPKSLQT
jgi:hypothetical protein